MSRAKELRRRAVQTLIAGFERADELGGELRDYIQERVLADERYIALRKRAAAMMGKTYESLAEREAEADRVASEQARVAPPKASTLPKADQALGSVELPAQIYGGDSDPWTGRAITLFESLKVDYDYTNIEDADDEHLLPLLSAETGQRAVPFIYLRGQFVGGFNAISELQRAGTLPLLLMTADQRAAEDPAMKDLSITPRPNSDEITPGEA
jgi:glutaredoxin